MPAAVRAREQIYLRRFAEAPAGKRQFAATPCLVVARLRTRRVSPFSETRSPAAAPPLPKKSLRMQIFFGSPFIPKGNGRYLPSPLLRHFLPFQVPFLRGENPKDLNRLRLCLRLFARAQRAAFVYSKHTPCRHSPYKPILFPYFPILKFRYYIYIVAYCLSKIIFS